MPLPRPACPYSFHIVQPSVIRSPAGAPAQQGELLSMPCAGPRCFLWRHDPGEPPETGDCVHAWAAKNAAAAAMNIAMLAQVLAGDKLAQKQEDAPSDNVIPFKGN